MSKLALIFLGSGLGGIFRYALAGSVQRVFNGRFPAGTLVVNLIGCLLIGFVTSALLGRLLIREEFRVALTVGLLGGFTTFSTFGFETFALLNDGQHARALTNIVLSVGAGLAAVWIGYRTAQWWLGA